MVRDPRQQYRSSTIGLCVSFQQVICVECGPTLNGKMSLEAVVRSGVVENLLERSVLQCSAVDVTGHPVVVEHRRALKSASDQASGMNAWLTMSSWYM